MTTLTQVILIGVFRNQEITVGWRRHRRCWAVSATCGGKTFRIPVHPNLKPCWSVSVRLLEERFSKAKPYVRQYGEQIAKEQGLKIVR